MRNNEIRREPDGRFVSVCARDVPNVSGTVIETVSYDSFGNPLNDAALADKSAALLTAHSIDSEPNMSLYCCCTRAYDPKPGRWLMADPIDFEAGDPNLHTYVANDPTELIE
jgi:RHS repeat-associated protein